MPAAEGWEGEIAGRFRDVDLDRVTERLKHKLSGSAEVLFRRARFRAGRLIDAAGDVTCNGGVVSRSLLYQANKSLGLVADSRLLTPQANALLLFRELKLGFTLDKDGIQIAGQCQSAGPGVVMTDEGGPLLSNQSREAVQVSGAGPHAGAGHRRARARQLRGLPIVARSADSQRPRGVQLRDRPPHLFPGAVALSTLILEKPDLASGLSEPSAHTNRDAGLRANSSVPFPRQAVLVS